MELLTAALPKNHTILLAGDLHYGSSAAYLKGWDAMLKRVATERNTYAVLMGDLIEAITTDDPRFSDQVHKAKLTPLAQAAKIIADLAPVKKKVLACLMGNHEMKLHRHGDITRLICDGAGVPYGGYSCKVAVTVAGEPAYKLFAVHGRFGANSRDPEPARRVLNNKLAVKRALSLLHSDCIVMAAGHTHQLNYLPPTPELIMHDDGADLQSGYTATEKSREYIHPDLRHYINTGSFLKSTLIGSTTYSEFAGYSPIALGYAAVQYRGGSISVDEVRLD